MIVVLYIGGVTSLLYCFYQLIIAIISSKKLIRLSNIKEIKLKDYPLISVIITAKDEEDSLKKAINSRLETDYPNIELIIINDRSIDKTAEIIKRISEKDKRVKIVNIEVLPDGWLGKLNALNEGVKLAKGDWLLFSDGDAFIKQGTLNKAMSHAIEKNLDFIAILPEFTKSNFLIDIAVSIFFRALLTIGRAYKAEDKNSPVAIGSGSFNFVKREAFEKLGGFEKLKMEVIDDVSLGQLLKSSGAKTSMLIGKEFVKVKWYSSLGSLFDGMGRAMMTGLGNFNFLQLFLLSSLAFIIDITPFILLLPFEISYLQIIGLISIIFIVSATIITDKLMNRSLCFSFFLPIGYVLIYMISLYGGLKFLLNGGLSWRNTFYSTKDLKKGRVFKYFPKT